MANDANFNFYLNRSGPRGQKGEKGDQGYSPSITVNTNTADEYTLLIQNEYDNFVTDNIRPTYDDRGGTYVRIDRANNVQYFGEADVATTAQFGVAKLATEDDVAVDSTTDNDSNVVTAGLLKTFYAGKVANDIVTTTNNVTIMGQKTFATPVNFTDNVLVRGGDLKVYAMSDTSDLVAQISDESIRFERSALFTKNISVIGTSSLTGNVSITGALQVGTGLTVLTGDVKVNKGSVDATGRNVFAQRVLLSSGSLKRVTALDGFLYADTSAILPNEYLSVGDKRLPLRLVGTQVLTNGKTVATTDDVSAVQTDLNKAKQEIIEAQADIASLDMDKQNKLTAGTGIYIDPDNVISATGGVVDLPIASSTTLGGIKVGENLTISEDGTLSATGGGGTGGEVSKEEFDALAARVAALEALIDGGNA